MNLIDRLISSIKKLCSNDETCVMIVFIFVGFMLCYLFKDEIDGFAPIEGGDNGSRDRPRDRPRDRFRYGPSQPGDGPIGIELNKRQPEPTPSMERQMKAMAAKSSVTGPPIGQHLPGVSVQESMMFKPFDEIWNPGFMPLDMVFKDIQKMPIPSIAGPQPSVGPKPFVGGPQPSVGQKPSDGVKGDLKVILVYAPWCGHSKKMLPDYEKVKAEFHGQVVNGKQVSILMYNSDVDKDKVKEYGVKGFPTLFVEKNGVREPFPHRSYDKIVEYIKNA